MHVANYFVLIRHRYEKPLCVDKLRVVCYRNSLKWFSRKARINLGVGKYITRKYRIHLAVWRWDSFVPVDASSLAAAGVSVDHFTDVVKSSKAA